MTVLLEVLLLAFLIFCAVAAILCRRLVSSVIIFMAYSAVMSLLWFLLESPDPAGVVGDHFYGLLGGDVPIVVSAGVPRPGWCRR